MSVEMPDPVPLDMPSGDPAAVEDLVRDVAGAAYWLAVLADQLSGPARAAPGWLGADATAAATQLARVAAITRESAAAVLTVTGRLSAHGRLLRDTRREVTALRAEQDEDFRTAWQRVGQIEDPRLAVMTGSSAWVGMVAELEATEARRRRRHALVLDELADDAAATVRELADAARPVGGTGRTGDGGRVLAYLGAELPGWGSPELTRRGVEMARVLDGDVAASTWNERAREVSALAGSPAFAEGLLLGLGANGLRNLFVLLGDGALGDDMVGDISGVARLMALALGTAERSDVEAVGALLTGTLVNDRQEDADPDLAALGMGAVLAVRAGSSGPGAATVASWGRQIVAREHAMAGDRAGTRAVERVFPGVGDATLLDRFDPIPLVLESLLRRGDAGAAAVFLGGPHAWTVLLDRSWTDDAAALGSVVELAAGDPGPEGRIAVRLGLETVGAGLVEGDPSGWTVDRDVVAAVSPALGDAVAAHVGLAADALAAVAARGDGEEASGDLLRGLGYVTVDRQAAATVEGALSVWAGAQSQDLAGSSRADPLPAVAVPAAYLAVQEYGQRLTHALDGFGLQEEAENRERLWNWTAGLVLEVVSYVPAKPVGVVADVVGAYGPAFLDMDGTFEQGADQGLSFGADLAGGNALATLPPVLAARADAVQAQSEASYRRTAGVLGDPVPPTSPEKDWVGPALDLLTGGMTDMATDELRERARRQSPYGPVNGLLPGRR